MKKKPSELDVCLLKLVSGGLLPAKPYQPPIYKPAPKPTPKPNSNS